VPECPVIADASWAPVVQKLFRIDSFVARAVESSTELVEPAAEMEEGSRLIASPKARRPPQNLLLLTERF
jgi:hypothetical protein